MNKIKIFLICFITGISSFVIGQQYTDFYNALIEYNSGQGVNQYSAVFREVCVQGHAYYIHKNHGYAVVLKVDDDGKPVKCH